MQFLIKIFFSALIIASVSELGKKFTPIAAILASLPLLSIIALSWLYSETKDVQKIIDLSIGIFWAVIPSLVFFLALPLLLKNGVKFIPAMVLAISITFVSYTVYVLILGRFGIKL